MSFISHDYKEPVTSNYVTLEEGENTVRLLGSFEEGTAVMGQEYWKTIEGKRQPKRLRKDEAAIISDLEDVDDNGNLKMPTFFWAIPVYNVNVERIQILKITQKTIRQAILALVSNKKWGDPSHYNIVIKKTEENGKTSYTVTPEPKETLDGEILEKFKNMSLDMEAYLDCKDPFALKSEED